MFVHWGGTWEASAVPLPCHERHFTRTDQNVASYYAVTAVLNDLELGASTSDHLHLIS